MGTRAQFFVGNPQDLEGRRCLGYVAFDGYPDGDVGEHLSGVTSEDGFVAAVQKLLLSRRDATHPEKGIGFPFPWADDLFLTDCTYAFFDGAVQMTWFHRGFRPLAEFMKTSDDAEDIYHFGEDTLPSNVPAPAAYDRNGTDSIMILSAGPVSASQ